MTEELKILFVCYGNICRSPMAEGFANNLPGGGIRAESAGIGTSPGKATPEAVETMKQTYGIDVSGHDARHINDLILEEHDYVIAMDSMVYQRLKELDQYSDNILFEWDIEDPIGLPLWIYGRTAEKIRNRLEKFLINRDSQMGSDHIK